MSLLHDKIYSEFIEALDANDNGISVYDSASTASLQKRFNDFGVTLGSLVSDLNYSYNDEEPSNQSDPLPSPLKVKTPDQPQAEEDARFLEASSLMGTTFLRKLAYYHKVWLPARTVVHSAYNLRHQNDPSGQIMVFKDGGVPWKDHLYSLEASRPDEEKVLYVLYPETSKEGAKWRVQCVSVTKDSFESRRPLREEWRGVRDEELSEKTGIEGCVFVHASGFIGGNKTREGAMEMARRSMIS